MSVTAAQSPIKTCLGSCAHCSASWFRLEDPQNRQRRDDFYANVGDAIRTLREETPLLFQQELTCEWAERSAASMRGPGLSLRAHVNTDVVLQAAPSCILARCRQLQAPAMLYGRGCMTEPVRMLRIRRRSCRHALHAELAHCRRLLAQG